jgi:prevent-host-death family protein
MTEVTIRGLRNHGDEVVDRVAAGEHAIVTRYGKPVAELRPVRGPALTAQVLLTRWRRLPKLNAHTLRVDLDRTVDAHPFEVGG